MTQNPDQQPDEDSNRDDVLIPPITLEKSGKLRELRPRPQRPPAKKNPKPVGTELLRSLKGLAAVVFATLQKTIETLKPRSSSPETHPQKTATPSPAADVAPEPPPAAAQPEESQPATRPEEKPEPQAEPKPPCEPTAAAEKLPTDTPVETENKPPPPEPAPPTETETKQSPPATSYAKKIFLVQGIDERMKKKVTPVFEKLGFEIIRFDEGNDEQHTLFERSAKNTDVGFAVVLLTVEDCAYPKDEKPAQAKVRVGQNVVFQLGFLIAKLGRQRVFVLHPRKNNFELPTRYFDVYYTPLDSEDRWKRYLLDRLRSCGYRLPEKIAL